MSKQKQSERLIPVEVIERRIFLIRGHKVMLDRDLAELYGVTVKRLNEQVKRNRERFPEDFMFQLTLDEGKAVLASRSQIATLKRGKNIKYALYAFTEHGSVNGRQRAQQPYCGARQHPGRARLRQAPRDPGDA
jgi:ORF6N domain